jgi:hypothetical protein
MSRPKSLVGLPLFVTGYFALAMVQATLERGGSSGLAWLPLLLPIALAFSMRRAEAMRLAHQLKGSALAFQLVASGALLLLGLKCFPLTATLGLFGATLSLYAASTGALLFISGVEAPGGLEPHEPRASSRDALVALSLLWILMLGLSLGKMLFPAFVRLSPLALDAAMTFACLGSLCLLLAAEMRVLLLRGLELGTLDRARGGVAVLLAALWVCLGAIFFDVAALDSVAEATLAVAALATALTKTVPDPTAVARGLRRTLTFLVLGGPAALGGAYLMGAFPTRSVWIFLFTFPVAAVIGASAEALAAPLRPERGRWIRSLSRANQAALDADTHRALINVLGLLKTAERRASHKPEAYAIAPGEVLSVDLAGHLGRKPAEFPKLVYELACLEPYRVLRKETLLGLEVRRPDVRPALSWFQSHEAGVAIGLADPDGPIGLLVLPEGQRKSRITHEEARLMGHLADRFSGIVAVHSALARSREREEKSRALAEQEHQAAIELRRALQSQVESRLLDAAILAEPVRTASLSPRARDTLRALEAAAESPVVVVGTPAGIDPLPWVAHLHLSSQAPSQPLHSLDLTSDHARAELYPVTEPSQGVPAIGRAPGGTLLIQAAHMLTEAELGRILEALSRREPNTAPARVVLSVPSSKQRSPEGQAEPTALAGARHIALPELKERPEDLQTLVVYELSRISLRERGEAVGIQRAALEALIERPYAGGEAELRGVLSQASARTSVGPITLHNVVDAGSERPDPDKSPDSEPDPEPRRARARTGPRSRYS